MESEFGYRIHSAFLVVALLLVAGSFSANAQGTSEELSERAYAIRDELSVINQEVDAVFERIWNDNRYSTDLNAATNSDDRRTAFARLQEQLQEAKIEHLELFPGKSSMAVTICYLTICESITIQW